MLVFFLFMETSTIDSKTFFSSYLEHRCKCALFPCFDKSMKVQVIRV